MASLSKDGTGWRVQFSCPATKKRQTLRTGKCTKKNAETTLSMIERLIETRSFGQSLDSRTIGWLNGIDSTLYTRLANTGLVEDRQHFLLENYIDSYIELRRKRGDVSKSTLAN